MRKSNLFLYALLLIFLTNSCIRQQRPEKLTLKIIETSDVHGAIFPYDLKDEQKTDHSLAQVSTYVEEERANPQQEVILLDNGDILQGDPIVYYYNFIDTTDEHICAGVMNYMDYDAATVGNHDIEPGHPVYDRLVKEFHFPWMAANAVDQTTGKPYFKPYVVLKRKGVKIAVLGLITPAIPKWLPEKIWSGIEFEDMVETARKWVKIIHEKEHPDLLVGLFHSGVDYTYGGEKENTFKNENASKIVAEKVPGFDIIFVGHDHHGWNETVENSAGGKVLILGPTSKARDFAVADIEFSLDQSTGQYTKNIKGNIVETKNLPPDPAFTKRFSPALEKVRQYVASPVCRFDKPIDSRNAFFGDAAFTDLIQQAQLEITGAQISFLAPLDMNVRIDTGICHVSDMYKLYRFENLLYTMKLTGKEIKDYLEYSADLWFNRMKNKNDHLLKFKTNEDGTLVKSAHGNGYQLANAYYNFDSGEGLIYTVDVSKPDGEKVVIYSLFDGTPFNPEKTYTVAINSYRGNGGGGHLTKGAGIAPEELNKRIVSSTAKDLRYYLEQWLEAKGEIVPEADNNWKIVPEDWAETAGQKDYRLLFGENENR
jgi:2',3'-cyclic-nucleotide 2'-phosphodiesterase/3'-nucleotidase